MTKTFAAQAVPFVLAAALTIAMLATTNSLAGHQYRVAAASQAPIPTLAMQRVTIVAHRA
jgi:hypothetical protein